MHIAAALSRSHHRLLPALRHLRDALDAKSGRVRRHHQDRPHPTDGRGAADPGPGVFRLRRTSSTQGLERVEARLPRSATSWPWAAPPSGTGLNTHPDFADRRSATNRRDHRHAVCHGPNKFEALAAHDAMVEASGALKTLAGSLIEDRQRHPLAGSGPRCGIGELTCPPTSRVRRSCRARSIRPSARR